MSVKTRLAIATAFAAAVAAPALFAATTSAATQAGTPAFKAEKCYGIAKAGSNDCASTGNNSCGGTSKRNGDTKAWIFVPEGYCERIVGGSKTAK